MMPKKAFADVMTEWEKLATTVAANKDDLSYIDGYRQQLEIEMAGAKAANVRQSAAQAESQQASRDLDGFLASGSDLANRVRTGIKSKYGIRSEKLKEFGLKVFRGKKKSSTVKPPPQVEPPTAGPPTTGAPSSGTPAAGAPVAGTQHAEASPALQAAPANEAPRSPTSPQSSE
jgi:hypothetical protein